MSYYKLIQLINNPKKQINNIVFSPHHIRSKCIAFGKVNFSANNKYELFAYNGITTYGYFKFNNDLYIIVVEYNEPSAFYVCDYTKESDDYINYNNTSRFAIDNIPTFVL